ncbi:MAG: hypothetical protein N2439_17135 [Anaerolineae bacterium]|nr:hypothetical protein [Anaerolineae bacterium]
MRSSARPEAGPLTVICGGAQTVPFISRHDPAAMGQPEFRLADLSDLSICGDEAPAGRQP